MLNTKSLIVNHLYKDVRMDIEPEIDRYKSIKGLLFGVDYEEIGLQSSFRKMRHHIDRMILQLEELKKQKQK